MSNKLTAVVNGTFQAAAAAVMRDDHIQGRIAHCWRDVKIIATVTSPTGLVDRHFLAEAALLAAAIQADAVTWVGKEWAAAETLTVGGFDGAEGQTVTAECGRHDNGARWVGDPVRVQSFIWLTGHIVLTQSTLTEVLARAYLESKGYTIA